MNNQQTFTFETRDQYIAWRNQWRDDYKSTSIALLSTKAAIKKADREGNMRVLRQSHYALITLKRQANELLDIRAQSKIEAANARNRIS